MTQRDPLENPHPLIGAVYSYVAYRIGEGASAEDVTSATFERARRYRHTFDPERGEPLPWLVGIAARCVDDHLARPQDPPAEAAALPPPGKLAADAASRFELRRAVASLAERDRELVALRYGAELTAAQMAALSRVGRNAVEVAIARMLLALRTALEQPGAGMTAPEHRREPRRSD